MCIFQHPVSDQIGVEARARVGSDVNSSQHMEAVVITSRGLQNEDTYTSQAEVWMPLLSVSIKIHCRSSCGGENSFLLQNFQT
jgi:hypothetical protein